MLAIVIGLLLTLVVALGVLVLVALPNLRQGSRILTPNGQRAVKRARKQAKQKPLAAVGGTWHGLIALKCRLARLARRIPETWAPISLTLHGLIDRLEERDAAKSRSCATLTPTMSPIDHGAVAASNRPTDLSTNGTETEAGSSTGSPASPEAPATSEGPASIRLPVVAEKPVAAVAVAVAVVEASAPVVEASAPAVEKSAPAVEKPAAKARKSAPAAKKSTAKAKKSAAKARRSAPAAKKSTAKAKKAPPAAEKPMVAEKPAPKQDRFDVGLVVGRSSVGRPRPVPPISGSIPEITESQVPRTPAAGAGVEPEQMIARPDPQRSEADREVGSARPAR